MAEELYTSAFGRNVQNILIQAERVIRGPMPASVRKELMIAVKAGALGRLPKDGLKPEIFFHPDHRHGAVDRQTREAEYSVKCIAAVMASPAEVRAGIEANGGDVLEYAMADRRRRLQPPIADDCADAIRAMKGAT